MQVKITDAAGKMMTRSSALSEGDKLVITDWAKTMQKHGPEKLRAEDRWNDHDLSGAWAGYRASSFSPAGRIIYKIIENVICVAVVRITTTHDYGDPVKEELKEIGKLEQRAKAIKPEKVK
jgi:mRNA-degrading endonuclease YafQ of YafQ-DinJ toxin-antitoxin module